MGRPQKQTVDYFPHDAVGGKTLFILQSRFGNNGYAVWFKLLALLCRTPGHSYNCQEPSDWQFLLAEMALSGGETQTIMDCLAELKAIDTELWQHRIIWSQNLVNRLESVYKERKTPLPVKPPINAVSPPINPEVSELLGGETPQSKLKETKVNKTKVNKTTTPIPPSPEELSLLSSETQGKEDNEPDIFTLYQREVGRLTPFISEQLKDAQKTHSAEWVRDAIRVAVLQGHRQWSYIEGILKNWSAEGRDDIEPDEQVSAPDPPAPEARGIWERAQTLLQKEVHEQIYLTWFSNTIGLRKQDGYFLIGVPRRDALDYLAKNHRGLCGKALTEVLKEPVKAEFCVVSAGYPGTNIMSIVAKSGEK